MNDVLWEELRVAEFSGVSLTVAVLLVRVITAIFAPCQVHG